MGGLRRGAVLAALLLGLAVCAGLAAVPPTLALDSGLVTVLGDEVYQDQATIYCQDVAGQSVFLGTMDRLTGWDMTNPQTPQMSFNGTGPGFYGVSVSDGYAYAEAARGESSFIAVLNLSDRSVVSTIDPPTVPHPPTGFPPQLSFPGPLLARDDRLYVAHQDFYNPTLIYQAISIYDVSDPANPTLLGQARLRDTSPVSRLLLQDGYLYVGEENYVETVDVRTPSNPQVTSTISTSCNDLALDGPLLFSGRDTEPGLVEVYSLLAPAQPQYLGDIESLQDLVKVDALAVVHPAADKSFLVVAWRAESFNWVDVYDVTLSQLRLGEQSLLCRRGQLNGVGSGSSVSDVGTDDSLVYVGTWGAGTRVIAVDWSAAAIVTPRLSKSPTGSLYTLRRSGGAVTWRFSATLKTPSGSAIAGKVVRLQRSSDGRHWTTKASPRTNAYGKVSVRLRFTSRGTTYWRWYSPASATYNAAATSKTRLVVR